MILPCGLVSLMIVKVDVGPFHEVNALLQFASVAAATGGTEVAGSEVAGTAFVATPVTVATEVSAVSDGSGVSVAGSVGLAVAVGGTAVFVGMACSVCATIVNAAASAVCCTSAGAIVGAALGAQALMIKTSNALSVNTFCFM